MPELPEVESVRRSLIPHLLGATIARAISLRTDIIDGDPSPGALLQGATITSLERHGKQLALIAHDGRVLVVQLGMTGQLLALASDALAPHTHALWQTSRAGSPFSPGWLQFRDPRRFGGLTTLPTVASLRARWHALGPDGLAITARDLAARTGASARAIKAALLDQAVVAGVGNIYADESLFRSGICPKTRCRRLKLPHFEALAAAVRSMLAASVEAGGSTLRDYVDGNGTPGSFVASHAVYGRAGLACSVCGTPLKLTLVCQRTTVWCPTCQPVAPFKHPPTPKNTDSSG